MFHGLRDGELHIQHPRVTQYHDEETQAPSRIAYCYGTELAPIHLSGFPWLKRQSQKRLGFFRAYGAHVHTYGGIAAGEPGFT